MKLRRSIHDALRSWHKVEPIGENSLNRLLLFRNAGLGLFTNSDIGNRNILNTVIENSLSDLAKHQTLYADLLRRRFLSGKTILRVAYEFHLSEDQTNRRQREAIDALTQLIEGREFSLRREQSENILAQLPPRTYSSAFGQDNSRQLLFQALSQPSAPWVLALVGLGGIGKSALADQVTRKLIPDFVFSNILWIAGQSQDEVDTLGSADGQWVGLMAQLASRFTVELKSHKDNESLVRKNLKEKPTLVIIDDFEPANSESALVERLQEFAAPSKFLLISRVHPASEVGVFQILVPELDLKDAESLLKDRLKQLGMKKEDHSAQAKMVDNLVLIVGGHPAALKLATTMLQTLPLSAVQSAFVRGNNLRVEALYKNVYEKNLKRLSPEADELLLAMTSVSERALSLAKLQSITRLSPLDCESSLEELTINSLIERIGGLSDPLYRVHQLTRTFLMSDFAQHISNNK